MSRPPCTEWQLVLRAAHAIAYRAAPERRGVASPSGQDKEWRTSSLDRNWLAQSHALKAFELAQRTIEVALEGRLVAEQAIESRGHQGRCDAGPQAAFVRSR